MYKKIIIFLLLLFIPFFISAEELKMDWQKSWGGTNVNEFISTFQTEDGGFIVCGLSNGADIDGLPNNGSSDAIIVKYDKDGNMLWQTSWGGNSSDGFYGILQTQDGGFIGYGFSSSTDIDGFTNKGAWDSIIVKYDKDGNVLWQTSWGGNGLDMILDVIQTSDGGFIGYGLSLSTDIDDVSSGSIIVKFDKDGNKLWERNCYGIQDSILNMLQTEDNGFIASISLSSIDIEGLPNKGKTDTLIVKYDKDGNVLWQTSWGGNDNDELNEILQTSDGGFIVSGYSKSTDINGLPNKGDNDVIIVRYDKDGNMLWQTSWGGNGDESFSNFIETSGGGFIGYGYSRSTDIDGLPNKGEKDSIIVKYDKDGNMQWQTSWGGNGDDEFDKILQTRDSGFIVYGASNSSDIERLPNKGDNDVIMVKYNKDGNILWQTSWGGNSNDIFYGILQTQEGGFIGYGNSSSTNIEELPNKGRSDAIIVKYSIEYELENIVSENGVSTVEQQGKYAVITPASNDGYEVDKIIVKDKEGNVLDVEVTKLEDGTYSFDLYTDVSVEVLFREKLVNPKTGVVSYIGAVLSILFISIATFCVLVFSKKSYRL